MRCKVQVTLLYHSKAGFIYMPQLRMKAFLCVLWPCVEHMSMLNQLESDVLIHCHELCNPLQRKQLRVDDKD